MKTVTFLKKKCVIELTQYENGRTAIVLNVAKTGETWTVATVNVPEANLNENEVLIKDYSELQGMLAVLTEAGIVKPTGKFIESGYVRIPICLLLPIK